VARTLGASFAFLKRHGHNRSMFVEKLRKTIDRYRMIEPGDRVLVAVSGGADSMVLLRALDELRGELHCELVVAHLDHGLRPSSADDARFVAQAAASLGLPCVQERTDVGAMAKEQRLGIEEAAREARRSFLSRTADAQSAVRVALGHTADDQAETVLFRLTRGSGWKGLGGMSPVSGRFVRPLLYSSRSEVRRFAIEREIAWREDETNADLRFARNRLRDRVLPELAHLNPDVVGAVSRAAALAREAHEVERFAIARVWPDVCLAETAGLLRLSRRGLTELPPAVQNVVLREALRRVRGDLRGLSRAHVAATQRLLSGSRKRCGLDLPHVQIEASPTAVEFTSGSRDEACDWVTPLPLGRTTLSEARLVIDLALCTRSEAVPSTGGSAWIEVADADCIAFPLLARRRRAGDRFAPLGLGKEVRLKTFLINAHVPRERRDRLALVCDQERVIWVAGLRLSDAVKLRGSTERVLVLRAEEARP
jgi:tRNA(Ile)-lysidine synthase